MDFSVHSLASGSSGNALFIQAGGTRILIDAGLTILQIQKRLSKFRVAVSDLDAVFLTHEHGDHARSAHALSKWYGVPVIGNPATLAALSRDDTPVNWRALPTGDTRSVGALAVESFPVSHDAADPVGYNIYHRSFKVSLVTDTGLVTEAIASRIERADLMVVEANHDVDKLLSGPYPWSLKARIAGDLGHLSNEAAAELVARQVGGRRVCVWLAHLSATNNSPRLAKRRVQSKLDGSVLVEVAERNSAYPSWRPDAQLSFFAT
ncbi:MAG: MBL fold metallo-hydrolase [Armatimonadota bacterium]